MIIASFLREKGYVVIGLSLALALLIVGAACGSSGDDGAAIDVPIVEEGTRTVNGIDLYYKKVGEGDPVIVLHAIGLGHDYLLPQFAELADEYQLIFFDQRGIGGSSGSVGSDSVTVENLVADLEGLRAELGIERVYILSHSASGIVALSYALEYPEHVRALALVETAGVTEGFWDAFIQAVEDRILPIDSPPEVFEQLMASVPCFEEQFNLEEARLHDQFRRAYFFDPFVADELCLGFNARTLQNLNTAFESFSDNAKQYDLAAKLGTIESQTLIVHCDFDPFPIEFARAIHDELPNSQFVELTECGHFPHVEASDLLFEEVRAFFAGATE